MAVKYVKLRPNLDNEKNRWVYEWLNSCGGSLCRAAVSALYDHTQRLNEDAFLERIIQTIRGEVQKTNVLSGLASLLQQPAIASSQPVDNRENEDAIADFLSGSEMTRFFRIQKHTGSGDGCSKEGHLLPDDCGHNV